MRSQSDEYYIRKTLEGNVNAFAHLIEKYKGQIYTLALRMVKQPQEAEELAQDAFIKAYKALPDFKGEAKFSTWLYKITYYTGLNRIKKNARQAHTVELENWTGKDNDVETAWDVMLKMERKQTIEKALEQLEDENRVLICLYYFDELSIREISTATGLSVSNIKTKLFRTRKQLFVILSKMVEHV